MPHCCLRLQSGRNKGIKGSGGQWAKPPSVMDSISSLIHLLRTPSFPLLATFPIFPHPQKPLDKSRAGRRNSIHHPLLPEGHKDTFFQNYEVNFTSPVVKFYFIQGCRSLKTQNPLGAFIQIFPRCRRTYANNLVSHEVFKDLCFSELQASFQWKALLSESKNKKKIVKK